MDFRQIDKDLQLEFAKKKIIAEKIVAQNLSRVNANPVYKKLDRLERQLVLEISKCKAKTETFKNLKANLETLRTEKNKVLASMKMKESDLKPKYSCKICLDSGLVNGRPCECYKKRKNIELIKAFGLSAKKDCSFKNFDTKICKNEKMWKTCGKPFAEKTNALRRTRPPKSPCGERDLPRRRYDRRYHRR